MHLLICKYDLSPYQADVKRSSNVSSIHFVHSEWKVLCLIFIYFFATSFYLYVGLHCSHMILSFHNLCNTESYRFS